jgi:hypothetical protein
MEKIKRITLISVAFLLCVNFSMDQKNESVSGGAAKPSVDFHGTIRDNTGSKFEAANITLSGLYKQIPVYQIPKKIQNQEYNPTINTVRLDLAEIHKIAVPHPTDIHTFNNRKYIEIEVYSKDAPTKAYNYLIENRKKVLCDQVNNAGPIERELQFAAIQEIIFEGFARQEAQEEKTDEQNKKKRTRQVSTEKKKTAA